MNRSHSVVVLQYQLLVGQRVWLRESKNCQFRDIIIEASLRKCAGTTVIYCGFASSESYHTFRHQRRDHDTFQFSHRNCG